MSQVKFELTPARKLYEIGSIETCISMLKYKDHTTYLAHRTEYDDIMRIDDDETRYSKFHDLFIKLKLLYFSSF